MSNLTPLHVIYSLRFLLAVASLSALASVVLLTIVNCFDCCGVVLSLVHGRPGWQVFEHTEPTALQGHLLLLLQRVLQLQCCFVPIAEVLFRGAGGCGLDDSFSVCLVGIELEEERFGGAEVADDFGNSP